ncbi:MAG: hypothetical protein K0R70_134 [Steroidobacteraceae bacterium]|nr:hypothetical protein [Steroidobacteraceae bacterium]
MTDNCGQLVFSGKGGHSGFSLAGKTRIARGFTLIEVLAALVIVALGMLGAITAVNQATRNGTYLREKTLAHWVAMNLLTERRLQASAPDVAETKGEVDFANERWRWTLRVTQTEVRSLRRMDVRVALAASPETSSLATLSGFYGTAISTAGGGAVVWAGSGAPGSGGDNEGAGDDDDGDDNGDGGRPNQPAQPNPPPEEPAEPGDEE